MNLLRHNNRAKTIDQKIEVVSRLVALWAENPELRLGQLIGNVVRDGVNNHLYNIEDFDLIDQLENFYRNRK